MGNREKWDKVFSQSGFYYGEEPISLLREKWERLRKGNVLDLAMGEGRNAVFLAEHGFGVTGFDISPVAIEKTKKLAYDRGVSIEAHVADLDLYVFKIHSFDTIILSYFKPISRYWNEIRRALMQGGTLLVEGYLTDQLMSSPLKELENKDYFFPNELLKNLADFHILFYNEDEVDGKSVVQCLAQKPTDRDAVKYGFVKSDATDKQAGKFKAAEDLFKKKS